VLRFTPYEQVGIQVLCLNLCHPSLLVLLYPFVIHFVTKAPILDSLVIPYLCLGLRGPRAL